MRVVSSTRAVVALAMSVGWMGCGGDDSAAPAPPPAGQAPFVGPTAIDCVHKGSGKDYQVGPGKEFETLGDAPVESLAAGDTLRIFWRAEPYHEKTMVGGVGTEDQPIRVCGVAGPKGELPVIDGEDATTRPKLDFPFDGHEVRGVIVVGHPHDAPYEEQPAHIVIEGLEVTHGAEEYTFTDTTGQQQPYSDAVAGIFVQRADHVTIRGCDVHDNNNGLFVGTTGGIELTQHVLIEGNYIHDNGSLTTFYNHNVYNEASDVVYQFNRMGKPRAGSSGEVLGGNIKERSAGAVIRYNWIEGGGHLIDLVDAQEAMDTTVPMPSFHTSHVYGNVLIRGPELSGSMVHYGGDSGMFENYRKGTLHFYENTVVVENDAYEDYDRPAVFELSTNDEHLASTDNVYFCTTALTTLRPMVMLGVRDQVASGVASFSHDWVTKGWSPYDQTPGTTAQIDAQVSGFDGSLSGADPGFVDAAAGDYQLAPKAPVRGAGTAVDVPADLQIGSQYVRHQQGKPRHDGAPPTLGAFAD